MVLIRNSHISVFQEICLISYWAGNRTSVIDIIGNFAEETLRQSRLGENLALNEKNWLSKNRQGNEKNGKIFKF